MQSRLPSGRCHLLSVALLAASLGAASLGAQQRPKVEQSLELLVPVAPVVVDVGGTPHLVYELHITNMRPMRLLLRRLHITASGSTEPLAILEGDGLSKALIRVGLAPGTPEPLMMDPGRRTVVYVWAPLRTGRPLAIEHRLEVSPEADQSPPVLVTRGRVNVDATPPMVLGPPLAGGPWVAIYDPQLMGGHRTAFYTVDGKARIPGRFAIDWIRAPDPSKAGTGAIDSSRNGFGSDVLAVSNSRVVAAIDDMPDLPDGAIRPAATLPLEQHSGNHVVLELGGGQYAFYEHLRHRSILVKAGERVRTGQKIAELGSSGSTSIGAHLHFHVADAEVPLAAEGTPFVFGQFEWHGAYNSLTALLAGDAWSPPRDGKAGIRRGQHPPPVSVLTFRAAP